MINFVEQYQGLAAIKDDMIDDFMTELRVRDRYYRKQRITRNVEFAKFRCSPLAAKYATQLVVDRTPSLFPDIHVPEIKEKVVFFGKKVVDEFMNNLDTDLPRDRWLDSAARYLHRSTVLVDEGKISATNYLHGIWAPDYAERLTDTLVLEGPELILAEAI